ncbi:MAG: hypothetical protein JWO67_7466 [Streptosporangiaceae bacterium]|nr:hypothetical protein [Streptosporangiaceae bacterium]
MVPGSFNPAKSSAGSMHPSTGESKIRSEEPPDCFPLADLPLELQCDVISWMPVEVMDSCHAMATTSKFYFALLQQQIRVVHMRGRTRDIAAQSSMSMRLMQFDYDLAQVATLQPGLRACAMSAIVARIAHLRSIDRIDAFSRAVSALDTAELSAMDHEDIVAGLSTQLASLAPCARKAAVVLNLARRLDNVDSPRLKDLLRLLVFHVCAVQDGRLSFEVVAILIARSERAPIEVCDGVLRAICACLLTLPFSQERAQVFGTVLDAAIRQPEGGMVKVGLLMCLSSYLCCMLPDDALVDAALALARTADTLNPQYASDILCRLGAGLWWMAEDQRLAAFGRALSAFDRMPEQHWAEILSSIAQRLTLLQVGPDRVRGMLNLLGRLARLQPEDRVTLLCELTICFDALPSREPAAKLVRALLKCCAGLALKDQFNLQMRMISHLRAQRRGSETDQAYCLMLDAALALASTLPDAHRLLRQLSTFLCVAVQGDALAGAFLALGQGSAKMAQDDRRIVLRNAFESVEKVTDDGEKMRCLESLMRHVATIELQIAGDTPQFLIDQICRMPRRLALAVSAIALRAAAGLSDHLHRRALLCSYAGALTDICNQATDATQIFNAVLDSTFHPTLALSGSDQLEVLGEMVRTITSLPSRMQAAACVAIRRRMETLPPSCQGGMPYRIVLERLLASARTVRSGKERRGKHADKEV